MAIKITDIDWDTDGEEVDLPTELVIDPVAEKIEDPAMEIADWLSDRYCWCVKSFHHEVVADSELAESGAAPKV
jgi:hypothetical protein